MLVVWIGMKSLRCRHSQGKNSSAHLPFHVYGNMETCKQHGTHMAFPFDVFIAMLAYQSLHLAQQAVGPVVNTQYKRLMGW